MAARQEGLYLLLLHGLNSALEVGLSLLDSFPDIALRRGDLLVGECLELRDLLRDLLRQNIF